MQLPSKRWVWRIALGLTAALLLAGVGLYIAYLITYGDLKSWAESKGFRDMLSHQVSRALKVHGEFGEIKLVEGLTADAESFESIGRSGEAIGELNAYNIRGEFNPWAIFRRVWQLKQIEIARGEFKLRMPEDALKEPLPQGDKPWYSFLMPQRFYCGQIVCPDADVEFPFRGTEGRLSGLHLTATMVGQDFKYDCRDGMLEFPYFPRMHVDELKMFITREKADIEKALLRGVEGDPARAEIMARIGMREDKSIAAEVDVEQMPVSQILPPELQGKIGGRLSGEVVWNTDKRGERIEAEGKIRLIDSEIKEWVWLDELARVHGNLELRSFMFDQLALNFKIENQELTAREVFIHSPGSFLVEGDLTYHWQEKRGKIEIDVRDMPLKKWLPPELKADVRGMAVASLRWIGHIQDARRMEASGRVDFVDTEIRNPVRLKKNLDAYGIEIPRRLKFSEAYGVFRYEKGVFVIDEAVMQTEMAGQLLFQGRWDGEDQLSVRGEVSGIDLKKWMRNSKRSVIHGMLAVEGDWTCSRWNLEQGSGSGVIRLDGGCFCGWGIQRTLVRFLKDESWLTIPVEPVTVEWVARDGVLELTSVDIFSPGKIGIRGSLKQGEQNELSGVVWLGLPEKNLTWLPGATQRVFNREEDGLHWVKVTMSGTVDQPEHDFDDQIRKQLLRHPISLIGLGLRGVSWWVGDVLGTYQEPVSLPSCPYKSD